MSVRCYLPASRSMLIVLGEGGLIPAGTQAYAVTATLLAATGASTVEPDDEEAEYAALMLAAEASVLLLDRADPLDRRRVVLAVDAEVERTAAADTPGEVTLLHAVHRDAVAAVHVDTGHPGAVEGLVDRAMTSRDAGDDDDLGRALDELADVDLGWYAPSELDSLV